MIKVEVTGREELVGGGWRGHWLRMIDKTAQLVRISTLGNLKITS
jgi:hypothetical protein